MQIINKIAVLLLLLSSFSIFAESPNVFEYQVQQPMSQIYGRLYKALEDDGFYVVFEANIGKNLSRMADKWGENYNQNQLDGIRSMVFCNGWYANAVSNADPTMLALCPLRLTLMEKKGVTTALFARPSVIAGDSPARKVLSRVENDVISIIKKSMSEQ
ncbi:MAG: DUF302 domain-containing protein [Gammaproteobacteria bacterium]|nr:DUF302 domain-containing protein [Gammaproteobacteria bacterium]MCW8910137.1 DUF302 domain-containing protein [Gammaproteobacteria bacterium]MCW9005851.1 DUF302 domain-containing protein [Gammaproteobacteria bacterium]MCW9055343.1 DUF302 domain-containing protein [Gammaproteobacteria bacterium]